MVTDKGHPKWHSPTGRLTCTLTMTDVYSIASVPVEEEEEELTKCEFSVPKVRWPLIDSD